MACSLKLMTLLPKEAHEEVGGRHFFEEYLLDRLGPRAGVCFEEPGVYAERLQGGFDGLAFGSQFLHPGTDEDAEVVMAHRLLSPTCMVAGCVIQPWIDGLAIGAVQRGLPHFF